MIERSSGDCRKPLVGFRLPAGVAALGDAQNRAYVVGDLKKPAGIRVSMTIVGNALREHEIQRNMQRSAHGIPAVVIIRSNGIESLEARQPLKTNAPRSERWHPRCPRHAHGE